MGDLNQPGQDFAFSPWATLGRVKRRELLDYGLPKAHNTALALNGLSGASSQANVMIQSDQ